MLHFEFGMKSGKKFDKKNILCMFVVEYRAYSRVVALKSCTFHTKIPCSLERKGRWNCQSRDINA